MSNELITALQSAAGNVSGDFYPYTVDNSCRFNDNDSAYVLRAATTTPNQKTFTLSCWLKRCSLNTTQTIWKGNPASGNAYLYVFFNSTGTLQIQLNTGTVAYDYVTSMVFRDVSAWGHINIRFDTTQASGADRVRVEYNGVSVALSNGNVPQNTNLVWGDTGATAYGSYNIGSNGGVNTNGDYYLSQVAHINGQALNASYFGEDKNGVWVPKNLSGLTFGVEGFLLDFADSSNLGNDVSGNNNDFTSSGLTSSDQVPDTPTNNFATANPLDKTTRNTALLEGNLRYVNAVADGNWYATFGSIGMTSGKYYWEICVVSLTTSLSAGVVIGNHSSYNGYSYPFGVETYKVYQNGKIYHDGVTQATAYTSTYTTGDIIGVCVDADAREVWLSVNGTFYGSPTAGTGGMAATFGDPFPEGDIFPLSDVRSADGMFNFGQDSSFAGNKTAQGNTDQNGIGDFYYTPPTGYLALCTANLPKPTIGPNSAIKPSDVFGVELYTGNGTAIGSGGNDVNCGVDMTSGKYLVIIKNRDAADKWLWFDTVRGDGVYSSTNDQLADVTDSETVTFTSTGVRLGNNVAVNTNTENYVLYWFKATPGFFDITEHTGNAPSSQNVSHDLGVPPDLIIVNRTNASVGYVYCSALPVSDPETDYLTLVTNNAVLDNVLVWNDTAPTSTQFTVGGLNGTNPNGVNVVSYLFANSDISKVFYYQGNGSVDSPFVYTGNSPNFAFIKRTDSTGSWTTFDSQRSPYNEVQARVYLDLTAAESTASTGVDFTATGIKGRNTYLNVSGGNYIGLSIGQPVKYSNAR
jgi:hypothetical protein